MLSILALIQAIVAYSHLSHHEAFHTNQYHANENQRETTQAVNIFLKHFKINLKKVRSFLSRCKAGGSFEMEEQCLRMVFNDDYFWSK